MIEPKIVHVQDSHTQADFRADWVQVGVKEFFFDTEFGDADGRDSGFAPNEDRHGRLHGSNF